MSEPHRLRLDGELTIYRAAEWQPALRAAIDLKPQAIELDLADVTEIDSAGVQLLLATKLAAQCNGSALALTHVGEGVTQTLDLLGLLPFFSDPASIPDATWTEEAFR